MHDHNLWAGPMDNICRKAFDIKVKDIMYTLAAGEYVEQGSSLGQAIHQLVIGYHQSLLVTNGKEVIGILRLTDVFSEIAKVIKQCEI
jgi:predicted transcriptional regulator